MKKTLASKAPKTTSYSMRPEYRFDYHKAHANRFAERNKASHLVVVLEPDIAQVFTTPEAVNDVLRALITAMPSARKSKATAK